MEILPLYTKKQMDVCREAGLDPTMIYLLDSSKGRKIREAKWNNVKKQKLGKLSGIVEFLKSVEDTKLKIEPVLYSLNERLRDEIGDEQIAEAISRTIESPSWRERATIMNLLTTIFGKKFESGHVKAACAIELVQEAFMVRDDVLDEQERCVSRDTVPKLYGQKVSNLVKDVLLSQAQYRLIDAIKGSHLDTEESVRCLTLLEEMVYYDTLGQWMDLDSENKSDFSEDEYFKMVGYTPGTQFKNLTTIVYLLVGGSDKQTMDSLQKFGKRLGMASQIRDDVIDIIGDEDTVYKKLGTDVHRRKKRLPLIKYLEENPESQKYFVQEKYPEPPYEELENILCKIRKSSALSYCIDKIEKLVESAIFYLRVLKEGREKCILNQIARLVANFDGSS